MTTRNLSYETTAHYWAHQVTKQASSHGERMFFNDKDIYSYGYHFKIAQFYDDQNVLFTADSYSVTTSKQVRIVKGAISHKNIIRVKTFFSNDDTKNVRNKAHKDNLCYYLDCIKTSLLKSVKARSNKAMYVSQANHALRLASEYIELFKVAKKYHPKALIEMLSRGFIETTAADLEVFKRAKEKADRAEARKLKKNINKWRKGENISVYGSNTDILRLTSKDRIETSKGVFIDQEEAKPLFAFISKCRKNKTKWLANGERYKIGGHYEIDYVNEKGDIKAGCHNIKYEESKRIAKHLKWI